MRAALLAIVGMAIATSAASAQYNTGLQAGPFDSNGPAGDPVNGVYSFTYSAADASFNTVRIRGTATSGGIGSFLSELRWQLVLDGGATRNSNALASGSSWTGGVAVDNSQSAASFSLTSGNAYSFRFWESFDDGGTAGVDATWSDVQFDLSFTDHRPVCANLGAMHSTYDINTFGSSFDTELGLYDDNGNLIGTNDDAGGTLQSQLTGSGLADGRYYIAIGGFNSAFGADWGATGGNAAGNYILNIDGAQAASGASTAGQITWYCVTVPTPGAASLLGLGGLVILPRRRR